MQALAVHDANAPQARMPAFRHEAPQQHFGLGGIAMMQIEFILRGVVAASQPSQHARRNVCNASSSSRRAMRGSGRGLGFSGGDGAAGNARTGPIAERNNAASSCGVSWSTTGGGLRPDFMTQA